VGRPKGSSSRLPKGISRRGPPQSAPPATDARNESGSPQQVVNDDAGLDAAAATTTTTTTATSTPASRSKGRRSRKTQDDATEPAALEEPITTGKRGMKRKQERDMTTHQEGDKKSRKRRRLMDSAQTEKKGRGRDGDQLQEKKEKEKEQKNKKEKRENKNSRQDAPTNEAGKKVAVNASKEQTITNDGRVAPEEDPSQPKPLYWDVPVERGRRRRSAPIYLSNDFVFLGNGTMHTLSAPEEKKQKKSKKGATATQQRKKAKKPVARHKEEPPSTPVHEHPAEQEQEEQPAAKGTKQTGRELLYWERVPTTGKRRRNPNPIYFSDSMALLD